MRTIYLGLLTLLFLISQHLSAQNYRDSLRIALEEIAAREIVPGFGVSIVNKEGILYEEGFGYAKVENMEAYTPQTIHNIGSVSKTFIGISIMKAVEMGLLKLETPINDLLPFKIIHPRHPDKAITLLHLASHTSGIRDGLVYEKAYVLKEKLDIPLSELKGRTRKEFKAYLTHQDMSMPQYFQKVLVEGGEWYKKKNFYKHAPGETYKYSNIGAALAAHILEIASGESFEAFTQKHILDPLNMEASGWRFSQINMDNHAHIYLPDGLKVPKYSLITFPDGGFLSSIHDLSLYLQEAIRGYKGEGKLMNQEAYVEMMKGHAPGEDDYSIFWEYSNQGLIGHNGSDPGIFTNLKFDPALDQGWLIFTNTNLDPKNGSLDQIRDAWRVLKKYGPLLEKQN
ncbi:MAG: serine hydrolase [Bacteroidia bacterium]|nr:serine hydrolase [Bacteroidia bacterium]